MTQSPSTRKQLAAMIQVDCKADAEKLANTPFTSSGVGAVFGEMLAMIWSLAHLVETLLPDEEDQLPVDYWPNEDTEVSPTKVEKK